MERQTLAAAILLVACQPTPHDGVPRDDGIWPVAADSSGGASSSSDGDDSGPGSDDTRYDVGGGGAPLDPTPPVILAEVPPPPISGGTMIISHDGTQIFAADPDRDLVYVVDALGRTVLNIVEVSAGCEPGRVVQASNERLHVVCRRSGEIVQVDTAFGTQTSSRYACENPRGIAVDPRDGSVVVACARGCIVRLGPGGTRSVQDIGVELRDVVEAGPLVLVSTFREPRVIAVAADGTIVDERSPPEIGVLFGEVTSLPLGDRFPDGTDVEEMLHLNTARKTVARDDGGWAMLHQAGSTRGLEDGLPAGESWGGSACLSPQSQVITRWSPGDAAATVTPVRAVPTAFDFALNADASLAAVIGHARRKWAVILVGSLPVAKDVVPGECGPTQFVELPGEATSVVFAPGGEAWVQMREPAGFAVVLPDTQSIAERVGLVVPSVRDTGHELFHQPTEALVACVSCHPEGRDDGMTWSLTEDGQRRTQALNVELDGGEPFHWAGDMLQMDHIFDEVRVELMRGPQLTREHSAALERWIFAMPPLNPATANTPEAVARGERLFGELGCATCHAGERFSNEATVAVGPHGLLQVPTLRGVAFRPPFMHDGRAPDLTAAVLDMLAYSEPGGPTDSADRADLVAYLETL